MKKLKPDQPIVTKYKKITGKENVESETAIQKSFRLFKKQNKDKSKVKLSDAIDELYLDGGEFDASTDNF
jgi:hypothetical protein